MKGLRSSSILRGEKGTALLETIPLLVVFVVLMSFGLGLFGAVHTAVLYSIAARTYSFETFRNRTNLYYFREDGSGLEPGKGIQFHKKGWRYQAVQNEADNRSLFVATTRPLAIGRGVAAANASGEVHNSTVIFGLQERNEKVDVSPIWVMVGYGICLNATCGN